MSAGVVTGIGLSLLSTEARSWPPVFEMIAEAGFSTRNKLITAISLSVAVGFTTSTEAGVWSSFPVAIQSIFAQNVVSVVFAVAIILNLILPKNMEDRTP